MTGRMGVVFQVVRIEDISYWCTIFKYKRLLHTIFRYNRKITKTSKPISIYGSIFEFSVNQLNPSSILHGADKHRFEQSRELVGA